MRTEAKVIKVGNSHGIRLPKTALALSGLNIGDALDIEVRKGRLILRKRGQPKDKLNQAYKDTKIVWEQALQDAWFEVFGPDYDD